MFVTPPRPCPYLPGRIERDMFVELAPPNADRLHQRLAHLGFRRSHNVVYRPDCPGCQSCVSVRVLVDAFAPQRSLARIWKRNQDLHCRLRPPVATREQFDLFQAYQQERHGDGEMALMDFDDYRAMIENTMVDSHVIEFRDPDYRLVATCLADQLDDGLSAVYSFFDPADARRSLGNQVILWLIDTARRERLRYVYLGYWIRHSRKMAYKARFQPLEGLGPGGWAPLVP
ncbi:MAG: arginyltransferase [Alphaproteobacteria bacterium]